MRVPLGSLRFLNYLTEREIFLSAVPGEFRDYPAFSVHDYTKITHATADLSAPSQRH